MRFSFPRPRLPRPTLAQVPQGIATFLTNRAKGFHTRKIDASQFMRLTRELVHLQSEIARFDVGIYDLHAQAGNLAIVEAKRAELKQKEREYYEVALKIAPHLLTQLGITVQLDEDTGEVQIHGLASVA